MRFLKRIGWALLILLAMAGMTVAVSTIAERGAGETLFSAAGLRVTAVGAGGALALLVILLFAALRVRDCRKRGKPAGAGEWMNGIGFGVLPGTAVWKIFEQATTLSHGKSLFEPLSALPYVTEGGCFQPSRIDMILAGAGFAVLLGCMIVRRKDYPGNGELLLRVLSVWTVVCALTENFRAERIAFSSRSMIHSRKLAPKASTAAVIGVAAQPLRNRSSATKAQPCRINPR